MPKKVQLSRLSQLSRCADDLERKALSQRSVSHEGQDRNLRVLRAVLPPGNEDM
jgi:hypothetical protein